MIVYDFLKINIISEKLKLLYRQKMDYFFITRNWFGYFLKQHGIIKTLKGILLYHYRILKLLKLDLSQEHIIKINECTLTLIPNDKGISERLLLFNVHEPLVTKLLIRELKEGMTCLEVGGNLGYYATLESKIVGDKGKIIAIEPSPRNFSYLKHNLEQQNRSNYEVYNFACGNQEGEVKFLVSDKSNRCMVIKDGDEIPSDLEVIKIPIKKLDIFLKEKGIEKIDFIRMDVEGYERNILEGAMKLLTKFKPLMLVEVHKMIMGDDLTKKFFNELKTYGYEKGYFVPRELDLPFMGNENDIRKVTINQLNEELENNSLPRSFNLLLIN